ncbi:MAG TPA: 2-C-methyl-D-erythritol 4-phosphate cytidylyltransferase [Ignavibacteria bacterium]|nr:2-C-methyl-D-erythritol 4-phosphate cytidylyltransferase [Bacteroidota bacterium]HRI83856.1 2-C-methyl-D-erythritol 4-phosphate cytidylyltransferase [Ignavibacteria bacterium]HRJ99897.1 2-C-methyl-D-erythritol 4-phosphate cytidylyltransferase [Ignavibacteria bacterium]
MKRAVKVIIPASGSGVRFGSKIPKQFLKINGDEILTHTVKKFHDVKGIDEIIIAAAPENFIRICSIIRKNNFIKVKKVVEGGKRRQDSVYNALINLDLGKKDIVLIHDAVRPLVSAKLIREVIEAADKFGCAVPGIAVSDTLKRTDKNFLIKETIDRDGVVTVQTPQAFGSEILQKCFLRSYKDGFTGTDESSIVEKYGYKVKVIPGEKSNVKITERKDLGEAKRILSEGSDS